MNLHSSSPNSYGYLLPLLFLLLVSPCLGRSSSNRKLKQQLDDGEADSLSYVWPLPWNYTFGNQTLTVDPNLSLVTSGNGGNSHIVSKAFDRCKDMIFKHSSMFPKTGVDYDLTKVNVIVQSEEEELQLGVDESYSLMVAGRDELSIIGEITIEANTVYGAIRGLETLSQLCDFDYETKNVELYKAPWYIQDKPRFTYRGLLLDTSRHYIPIEIIKQVIDSMSYAKLNVLHWHIIDEESFPLEVPTYPNLWKGAYTKWERYTMDDAYEIVNFAKLRGINVMAEVDVPGHAESWGVGYPDLWPSPSCREPLDVSKNFTFDLISGILADMRKIFPFELFHLGGDEVQTGFFVQLVIISIHYDSKDRILQFDCWNSTPHVKQWLQDHNFTGEDAYKYFVLRAQEIAISFNWTPVNWEETFNAFAVNLNPKTVVHNWLGSGVCPKAVAKGFKCIYSNQGFWYLDHLDVPWDSVYYADPLEGITDASEKKLVLGGEVCMWAETADPSNVLQTIWPRAAAAAERLWSNAGTLSFANSTVLPRLENFRCQLTRRGVEAAPVRNSHARSPPDGPGSCYKQ